MPEGLKIAQKIVVDTAAYERIKQGTYIIIPIRGDLRVDDNVSLTTCEGFTVSPEIFASVTAVDHAEYPPDGCRTWNGQPFLTTKNRHAKGIIQTFATLYPVKKEETPAIRSILVIGAWRESLEFMAQSLDLRVPDIIGASGRNRLGCSFDGRHLDEDEFCALNEKEQIECLQKLSSVIKEKLCSLVHKVNVVIDAVYPLRRTDEKH